MSAISPIDKYFELTPHQAEQFAAIGEAYRYWNERINVVSRKDIELLYERHVLHSLAIAKVCTFDAGARVCDVGCGGGFPTVPLAILFPEVHFTAVDSIGKKIRVLQEVARSAGITNIEAVNCRIEALQQRFDYCTSRAVTDLKTLADWTMPKISEGRHGSLPNGLLVLKGGSLDEEIAACRRRAVEYPISELFDEPFFETKRVVYVAK